MAQTEISKEEIAAVYPTVAATVADALGCDEDEVTPDAVRVRKRILPCNVRPRRQDAIEDAQASG